MRDIDTAWGMLRDAKEADIKLALDDFGTGYSSLTYLRRFNLDVLKIDRSFVAGIADSREDAAITQQLVAMAHALDIAPVAEGVDSLGPGPDPARHGLRLRPGLLVQPAPTDHGHRRLPGQRGRATRPTSPPASTGPAVPRPDPTRCPDPTELTVRPEGRAGSGAASSPHRWSTPMAST